MDHARSSFAFACWRIVSCSLAFACHSWEILLASAILASRSTILFSLASTSVWEASNSSLREVLAYVKEVTEVPLNSVTSLEMFSRDFPEPATTALTMLVVVDAVTKAKGAENEEL